MLEFPFAAPEPGAKPIEIADGVLWVRLAIPFALNHVNIYLLREGDGWLGVDAGPNNAETRAAWNTLLADLGGPQRLKRLLVTHHHIDHAGAAGWLSRLTGCEVLMSETEFGALKRSTTAETPDRESQLFAYFQWLGCALDEARRMSERRFLENSLILEIPERITPVAAGDTLHINGADWTASLGGGHTLASVLLTRTDQGMVIVGDQILSHISPFVGKFMADPRTDQLQNYLAFLAQAGPLIPAKALTLPGHGVPFYGAAERAAQLAQHHEDRCQKIIAACKNGPVAVRDIVDAVFTRNLDGVMGMALAETYAHLNLLVEQGRLVRVETAQRLMFAV